MNYIKQLAGQTAVYGLGIVIPRLLNFLLLTPFYTRIFTKAEYGVITELYAYVVFLMVILTYGMETGFFRYADKNHNNKNVYFSAVISLALSTLVFLFISIIFSSQIADIIDYPTHYEYIIYIGLIVGLDAFTAIPFARLRLENKALKYAIIRIFEVIINIGANWLFLFYCPRHYNEFEIVNLIYNPEVGVGYVFISNLIASIFKVLALSREIILIDGKFDFILWRKMLKYSFPLLIAGLAGTINEALDRVLLKHLIPAESSPIEQLGIYGANYKLAVLMTLFIQMFRYAAEPFFFSKKDEVNARKIYAQVMNYFVFCGMVIFLLVMLFIDVFKLFIGADFREGIAITPIILMANLFVGVFFNLSIWYKLTNKTMYGAYLVMIGAFLTILVNYLFVPQFGYYAAAWGHIISYSVMVVLSFIYGQKYFTIPYDVKRILLYVIIALTFYILSLKLDINTIRIKYLINSIIVMVYVGIFYILEKRMIFKKL